MTEMEEGMLDIDTGGVSLEDFIQARLMSLNFDVECNNVMSNLHSQVKHEEKNAREIKKILHDVSEQMQQMKDVLKSDDRRAKHRNVSYKEGSESDEEDIQCIDLSPPVVEESGPGPLLLQQRTHLQQILSQPPQTTMPSIKQGLYSTKVVKHAIFATRPVDSSSESSVVSTTATTKTVHSYSSKNAELAVGMKLFGKKWNDLWYKGTLVDIQNKESPKSEWQYKIKFDGKGCKVLSGKHISFHDTPDEVLPVGSRVVGLYRDEDVTAQTSFYAGIVAEPPSVRNQQRYLVFFDDGYAQYCSTKEIHRVCAQSKNVWEDIHQDSQEFIKGYIQQYPERPMVRLQKGQTVKTEWQGQWWVAKVQEVDASLVKMYFEADKRVEWLYRGSTRLEPLFTELSNAENNKSTGKLRRHKLNLKTGKKPFVEYTRGIEDKNDLRSLLGTKTESGENQSVPVKRRVAKKSTGAKPSNNNSNSSTPSASDVMVAGEIRERTPLEMSNMRKVKGGPDGQKMDFGVSSISSNRQGVDIASVLQERLLEASHMDEDVLGRVDINQLATIKSSDRVKYVRHRCSPRCLEGMEDDPVKYKGNNPLLIPMLCGWERQIGHQKNANKKVIFYRAPCARRLRSMEEVDLYLALTNSGLAIDLFCFEIELHTHTEFVPVKTFCDIKDLSYGKENVPISCVNGINRQYPEYVGYSNQRIPVKGVKLNLDPDFLVGCDCTDGCRDPSKCACQQLTLEASAASAGGKINPEAGYHSRRLKEQISTGIYECNARCKCDSRCRNRVVQNGLQLRLQVFKTENRGWGLRCLDDIPSGGFVCIYAGQLLEEQTANEDGKQYGDEYFAELDHIEVVERAKEGYESNADEDEGIGEDGMGDDVDDDDDDEEGGEEARDSDSTFSGEKYLGKKGKRKKDDSKVGKLVLKRDSTSKDKEWSVKLVAQAPQQSQEKTAEWVQKIQDDTVVIISDEEDMAKGDSKKSQPQTEQDGNKKPPEEELPDLDPSPALPPSAVMADSKPDSDADSLGDSNLQKPAHSSAHKLKLKLKVPDNTSRKTLLTSDKFKWLVIPRSLAARGTPSKEGQKGDETPSSEISGLRITEPTSLNTEGMESDDAQDLEEQSKDLAFKRTTRSSSRFSQLPNPKSMQETDKTAQEAVEQKAKKIIGHMGRDDKRLSSRKLMFGEDDCYIMDAKAVGNLGRYLNHSCSPNIFVQNVFVDTHDLRFPWITFFASQYIRAGTELTWDYSYEVGSVPGKVLYCYCGSAECRGRLL